MRVGTEEHSGITGGQLVMWEEHWNAEGPVVETVARFWYWKESSHESLLVCQ